MQKNKARSLNDLMNSDSYLERTKSDSFNKECIVRENSNANKSGVRVHFKPIHALSLLLILVVALCASLTLLITQSINYSRAENYRISSLKKYSQKGANLDENNSINAEYCENHNDESKCKKIAKKISKVKANKGKESEHKTNNNALAEPVNDNDNSDLDKNNSSAKNKNNNANKSCININTAGIDQLQTLNGVGPKMAERILDQRRRIGSFNKVSDLMKVKGIGQKTLEKFKGKVCAK